MPCRCKSVPPCSRYKCICHSGVSYVKKNNIVPFLIQAVETEEEKMDEPLEEESEDKV